MTKITLTPTPPIMNIHRAPRHFDLHHDQRVSHTLPLCATSQSRVTLPLLPGTTVTPGGGNAITCAGQVAIPPPTDNTHRHRNNTLGQFVADEPLLCSLPQKQMAVFLEAGSTPSTVPGSRGHHTRVSLDLQNIGLLRDAHFFDKS